MYLSFFFCATGLGAGFLPNSFDQNPLTSFATPTASSTVDLISTIDVFACLYNSQPSLIAATQALAANKRLIGSIYNPNNFLTMSAATPGPNKIAAMTI